MVAEALRVIPFVDAIPGDSFFKPGVYRASLRDGLYVPPPILAENMNPAAWKKIVMGNTTVFSNGWEGVDTQPGPARLNWQRIRKLNFGQKSDHFQQQIDHLRRACSTGILQLSASASPKSTIAEDYDLTYVASKASEHDTRSKSASVHHDAEHDMDSGIATLTATNSELGAALQTLGCNAKAEFMGAQTQLVAKLNAIARQAQAEFLSECLIQYERDYNESLKQEIGNKFEELEKEEQGIHDQMVALELRRGQITEELQALEHREKQLEDIWNDKIESVKKALHELKHQDLLSSHL